MINLFRKYQKGAATLLITVIILAVTTLVVLFAANYGLMQSKITGNQYRNSQALQAAEAGMEFGIAYLKQNYTLITAVKVSGFITPYSDASTTNISQTNGSKFSVVYTNPVANDYDLIKITSTGVSDDNSSTRIVSQLVQRGSNLVNTPTSPLTTKGVLTLGGSSAIINTESNTSIQSGSTVSISGSGRTVNASGTSSTAGNIKSDIQQNNSTLSSMSSADFFANYFGMSESAVSGIANYSYSNSGNTDYSSTLNGKSGSIIYINQTGGQARIQSSAVVGTPAAPVILIVNGDFKLSGSAVINGLVFVTGATDSDVTGSSDIIGGLITRSNLNITGSTTITYSSAVLNATQSAFIYFAKVPGSWKDY